MGLLIQSDISAFLVIDEEDVMVRVPHAHRVERDSTWQLEPCLKLGDLITAPSFMATGLFTDLKRQWTHRNYLIPIVCPFLNVCSGFGNFVCSIYFRLGLTKPIGDLFFHRRPEYAQESGLLSRLPFGDPLPLI